MDNESKKQAIDIRFATLDDATAIKEILEQHLIGNKEADGNTLAATGFLIYRYTLEDITEWIKDKKHTVVLVATKNNTLIGYLPACDLQAADATLQAQLKSTLTNTNTTNLTKVLYHKQVATKPGEKGVGKQLLLSLFDVALKQGYTTITCLIVEKPEKNTASIIFHEKFGFHRIGMMDRDERVAGVYMKSLDCL